MISPAYRAQVDLLLQVLPYVAKEEMFALKGGKPQLIFHKGYVLSALSKVNYYPELWGCYTDLI